MTIGHLYNFVDSFAKAAERNFGLIVSFIDGACSKNECLKGCNGHIWDIGDFLIDPFLFSSWLNDDIYLNFLQSVLVELLKIWTSL